VKISPTTALFCSGRAVIVTSETPVLGVWQRIKACLQFVLPRPVASVLSTDLLAMAAWAALAFLFVALLPLLSILAQNLIFKLLPDNAAKWSRGNLLAAIHTGYGIDEVRETLKKEASADVLANMQRNNESLDYVQYVEFFLTKGDQPKEIPASLHAGQRAKILVRRSQIVMQPDAGKDCVVPDVPLSQHVLGVSLDGFFIKSLPQMVAAGELGRIALSKDWWTLNLQKVKAETSISAGGIGSVRFSKTPEFERQMGDCVALKVEVIVEVYKQDPGGPT